ncbi:MAG: HEAT repeat protein [Chlamydiales bacterium]|jgi:HEAT repeat protein
MLRASTAPKMTRPQATGRRRSLAPCLPLLLISLGCASGSNGKDSGIPHDPNVMQVQRENLKHGPMGPLLTTLDAEVQTWNSLSLSADTDQKRRQVVILEQSLEYQATQRLDDLIAELQSRSVFNRMVAAVVLGFSDNEKALGPLVAALDDPSPDVEANVLLGLGILAHKDTPPELLEERLLHSSSAAARGNAALALRKIIEAGATSETVLKTARAGLIDNQPSVRSQCAILLASKLDTESIDNLEVLLHDEIPLVALAAARSLAYIGSKVPESKGDCARALTQSLDDLSPGVKEGILRTLMRLSRSNYGDDAEAWNEWASRLP